MQVGAAEDLVGVVAQPVARNYLGRDGEPAPMATLAIVMFPASGGWMSAGPARPDVPVPAAVVKLAGGAARPVWQNDAGGVVFEVTARRRRFVKWAPAASGIDLAGEAARLSWAVAFARVPELLDHGSDQAGSWIVTSALPGEMAVTARWKGDPARAVSAIGEGLRALHEALPAERCPFSWSADDRLTGISRRARSGLLDPARWHPQHRPLGSARRWRPITWSYATATPARPTR